MLHIRRATPDDIPLLQHMAITSYRHHFAHLWKNPDELAHFLSEEYGEAALQRSLSDTRCVWLIACPGRRLVLRSTRDNSELSRRILSAPCCISCISCPVRRGKTTVSRFLPRSVNRPKRRKKRIFGWKSWPIILTPAAFISAWVWSTLRTSPSPPPRKPVP